MKFLAGMTFGAVISALTWGAAVERMHDKHKAEVAQVKIASTGLQAKVDEYERVRMFMPPSHLPHVRVIGIGIDEWLQPCVYTQAFHPGGKLIEEGYFKGQRTDVTGGRYTDVLSLVEDRGNLPGVPWIKPLRPAEMLPMPREEVAP